MKIDSFSKITCCVLLFMAMILSVNAVNQSPGKTPGKNNAPVTGINKSHPHQTNEQNKLDPTALLKKYLDNIITKELACLKTKCEKLENEIKKIKESLGSMDKKFETIEEVKDLGKKIKEKLDSMDKESPKDSQEPEETVSHNLFIITVLSIGIPFGLLLISCLVLLIVLLVKIQKDKNKLSKEEFKDFSSKQASFAQRLESLGNQIIQKIPSVEAISSGTTEKLKGQFDSIRKGLTAQVGSKNEPEILEAVRTIKKSITGELETLRSQSANVSRQQAELQQKTAEAARKAAEAQKTIDTCEADKTKAVEAAKSDMRITMQNQFAAEKAKMNETVKQYIDTQNQKTDQIEKLTTECADLRSKAATAETRGYERGLNASQEEIKTLVRNNEHLSMELGQERTKVEKAEAEYKQKLFSALSEKEKEFGQKLISSQNAVKDTLEKQYKSEIERSKKESAEKTNSISILVQQKNQSDQKVSQLLGQVSQARTEIANEQKKTQAAEVRARESDQKANALQATVVRIEKEKESLQGTISNCKASIEKLTKEKEVKELSLHAAEKKISELQSVLYPSEYIKDKDFSILKEHLDSWLVEKIGAAEIIKSALGLFSQKATIDQETWQQALRNISVGITQVMREKKQSPNATLAELVLWSKFLMKFSDEDYDFSLKIPNIGDNVDSSWMSPKNNKTTKVNNVLTWAVWNNMYGVRHNAEVE